jgi:AbrB family looped-hinge helix DNA binding protein
MAIAQSRITSQGQVSVPAEVRRRLGVGPGSVIEWESSGDTILVRKVGKYTFDDMRKRLFPKGPPRHASDEELKEAIASHVRERHARR